MMTLLLPFHRVCAAATRIAVAGIVGAFFTFSATGHADLFEYHFFYGPATVTDPENGNVHSYAAVISPWTAHPFSGTYNLQA